MRGGGSDEVWQMTQVYNFISFEGFPNITNMLTHSNLIILIFKHFLKLTLTFIVLISDQKLSTIGHTMLTNINFS